MQFWHARAGMRVCLKPCTGRFVWAALPCSFRAVWPLLFPAPPCTIQGDRDDCCTKAILSQITLRVFISLLSVWREINSAAMLDFLHFLCLPLILRRTWMWLALHEGVEEERKKICLRRLVPFPARRGQRCVGSLPDWWFQLSAALKQRLWGKNRHGFTCVDENISNSWSGHHTRLTLSPLRMYLLICKENKMAK